MFDEILKKGEIPVVVEIADKSLINLSIALIVSATIILLVNNILKKI